MNKLLRLCWLCGLWLATGPGGRAQNVDSAFPPLDCYQSAYVNAAVQQPDGKYVVSGNFTRINGTAASAIARLNADGTLDPAFGNALSTQSPATTLTLLPGGQILAFAAGIMVVNGQSYANLVRLNPDGTVDASLVTGNGTSGGQLRVTAAQPDGKILLGGSFTTYNGTRLQGWCASTPTAAWTRPS